MTDAMTELQDVLERLSKKLDDSGDKAEEPDEKSDDKMAYEDDDKDKKDKDSSKDKKDDDKMDKGDLDDIITTEYLTWLESTVKSSGYDPMAARSHFDTTEGVEKAYLQEGKHGYDHRGQGSIEGAGEDDSSKRPKMNFGSGPSGNKNVIKGDEDYISADSVTSAQVEEAYQVYKAAAIEQRFKSDLGNEFAMRLQKEINAEENNRAKGDFDARGPLEDLQKAVLSLADRIEDVSTTPGEDFQKSDDQAPAVTIPGTTELAQMSWDDVHRLAYSALRSDE